MLLSEVLSSMKAVGSGWSVTFDEDWLQGRSAFGGLQAALALRAMRALVPELPLRTLQTTFIAPVSGTVTIEARVLRTGKSAVHVEARILQGGETGCLLLGIFGSSRESVVAIRPPAPQVARSAEQSRELPYLPGVTPVFTQHIRFRWADGGFPFSAATVARTQIYVEFRGETAVDEAQVVALADTIPSPGLSLLKRPVAASSLTWTLELLRDDYDPAATAGWLMDAEVTAAANGYMFQTATLWSPAGEAVALSRQSVVVFG